MNKESFIVLVICFVIITIVKCAIDYLEYIKIEKHKKSMEKWYKDFEEGLDNLTKLCEPEECCNNQQMGCSE